MCGDGFTVGSGLAQGIAGDSGGVYAGAKAHCHENPPTAFQKPKASPEEKNKNTTPRPKKRTPPGAGPPSWFRSPSSQLAMQVTSDPLRFYSQFHLLKPPEKKTKK